MNKVKEFYLHLKDAVFHGFLMLEWKVNQSSPLFFESAVKCERSYNESVKCLGSAVSGISRVGLAALESILLGKIAASCGEGLLHRLENRERE